MYKLADHGVIRIADGTHILPRQDGWKDYAQWVAAGNTAAPPDPAPVMPFNLARAEKLAAVRTEAYRRINAKWPLWKQINAALGIETLAKITELRSNITDVKAASNAAETAIVAATTQAELDRIIPAWPTI